jgi:hypothetical protein
MLSQPPVGREAALRGEEGTRVVVTPEGLASSTLRAA